MNLETNHCKYFIFILHVTLFSNLLDTNNSLSANNKSLKNVYLSVNGSRRKVARELWPYPFHLLILKHIQVVIAVPISIPFPRKHYELLGRTQLKWVRATPSPN